jgi:hypothetical protein
MMTSLRCIVPENPSSTLAALQIRANKYILSNIFRNIKKFQAKIRRNNAAQEGRMLKIK